MTGIYKLEIEESEETLKKMLREQKTGRGKERVQVLYLLKSQKAATVEAAASLIGRNRVTVQDWLKNYREGGIEKMLEVKKRSGRPRKIPPWAENALAKQLQSEEGFQSYEAIGEWLEDKLGVKAKYTTVYKTVHYRLQGSPKVPRPQSQEQSEEQLEAFKKTS